MVRVRLFAIWFGVLSVGCPPSGPQPLVIESQLSELVEVVACRHSHEHELRHVRIFTDPDSVDVFNRCVLSGLGERCGEPNFAPGSLFVKYEYDRVGCVPEELLSYTATLKLEPGSYPAGFDWHWQRLDADFRVTHDGAPAECLSCHIEHCASPAGFDLRCLPD